MAKRVSCYLDSINDTSEHVSVVFCDPLTLDELNVSMKQPSNTKSFNPNGFHVKMMKNRAQCKNNPPGYLQYKLRACSMALVSVTKSVFFRKPNKDRYDDCSSYRPLSIASHFGSFLSVCCAID